MPSRPQSAEPARRGTPVTLSVTAASGRLLGSGAALAVPLIPAKRGAPQVGAGAEILRKLRIDAAAILKAEKATGRAGEVVTVPVRRDGVDAVLFVGVGDESQQALRKAAAAAVRKSAGYKSLGSTLAAGRDRGAVRAVA